MVRWRRKSVLEEGRGRRPSIKVHTEHLDLELDDDKIKKRLSHKEIVENHRQKSLHLFKLQKKVSETRKIIYDLNYAYKDIKTSWCWQCRTDELLSLVEDSIETYEVKVEKMEVVEEEANKSHAVSPINRLLQDCRRMSLVTHAELELEKQYYIMNDDDIIVDMVRLEAELAHYEMQHDQVSDRMKQLRENFKTVEKIWCWNLHRELQRMVELATVDCLTD